VSPSLISQIETGKSEPSVSTLFAIVSELDLPVNEIVFASDKAGRTHQSSSIGFDGDASPAPKVRLLGDASAAPVQRSDSRLSIQLESGVSWQRLTSEPDHDVDFLYLRYEPGGQSTPPDALMRHSGREYGYILSGRLRVSLGFDTYELGPGDTISFDCTQPHRFATVGNKPVEAVWFVVGRRHAMAVDELPATRAP